MVHIANEGVLAFGGHTIVDVVNFKIAQQHDRVEYRSSATAGRRKSVGVDRRKRITFDVLGIAPPLAAGDIADLAFTETGGAAHFVANVRILAVEGPAYHFATGRLVHYSVVGEEKNTEPINDPE